MWGILVSINSSLQKCTVQVTEAKDRISIEEGKVQLIFSKVEENSQKTQWMQKVIGLENRPRIKKKNSFSFPKETREGKSLWVYLTPSLVYIPHVGIEFYMNDEIIQIKLIVVIKGSHKT